MTFDGEIVRYNDNDLYILSWGAGSPEGSSRRKFLEDRNFQVTGKRVTNAALTCWLDRNAEGRQRNAAKKELNSMG